MTVVNNPFCIEPHASDLTSRSFISAAQQALEAAMRGSPENVWSVNSSDLDRSPFPLSRFPSSPEGSNLLAHLEATVPLQEPVPFRCKRTGPAAKRLPSALPWLRYDALPGLVWFHRSNNKGIPLERRKCEVLQPFPRPRQRSWRHMAHISGCECHRGERQSSYTGKPCGLTAEHASLPIPGEMFASQRTCDTTLKTLAEPQGV